MIFFACFFKINYKIKSTRNEFTINLRQNYFRGTLDPDYVRRKMCRRSTSCSNRRKPVASERTLDRIAACQRTVSPN